MDPRKIPREQRYEMEQAALAALTVKWQSLKKPTAAGYPVIEKHTVFSEPDAAAILGIDYSTLKRIRRAELVPFTPKGQKGAVYFMWHLIHYHLFGRKAVLLWGGELPDNEQQAAE